MKEKKNACPVGTGLSTSVPLLCASVQNKTVLYSKGEVAFRTCTVQYLILYSTDSECDFRAWCLCVFSVGAGLPVRGHRRGHGPVPALRGPAGVSRRLALRPRSSSSARSATPCPGGAAPHPAQPHRGTFPVPVTVPVTAIVTATATATARPPTLAPHTLACLVRPWCAWGVPCAAPGPAPGALPGRPQRQQRALGEGTGASPTTACGGAPRALAQGASTSRPSRGAGRAHLLRGKGPRMTLSL